MTNYKIIRTDTDSPDVLLMRNLNSKENMEYAVDIIAIGVIDGYEDMLAIETVIFDLKSAMHSFIENFTVEQADTWCKQKDITYE